MGNTWAEMRVHTNSFSLFKYIFYVSSHLEGRRSLIGGETDV